MPFDINLWVPRSDRDKYECNARAVQQSGFDPSAPNAPPHLRTVVVAGPPPGSGVAAGAATGAVLGAALSRPWKAGQRALAGALAGAAIGGIAESAASEQAHQQQLAASTNATNATNAQAALHRAESE